MTDPTPTTPPTPPQGLTDAQLLELAEKELCIDDMQDAHEEHYPIEVVTDGLIAAMRAAIAAHEAARPQPVPVAERPWERPGWCDAEGRCWFGAPVAGAADAGWILRKPSERLSHQTACLPHWAIPQPPQGGEVGA